MTKRIRWFALGAVAVAFGACSDSVVTPATDAPGAAAYSATLNGNSFTIASDAGSQFCPDQEVLGVFTTFPGSYAPITSGCIPAEDLEVDGSLAAYNPGWEQLTGGHWIGFTENGGPSSDYRPTPSMRVFQQTFTLPSGVTSPSLSLNVRADNVVAVYLNGHHVAEQSMNDCNDGAFGPCHWTAGGTLVATDNNAADFNNPGLNYITFLVNDVPTGYPDPVPPGSGGKGGPPPQYGCPFRTPQEFGSHGFSNDQAVATLNGHAGPHPTGPGNEMSPTPTLDTPNPGQDGCENPAGLDFAGSVSWTPVVTGKSFTIGPSSMEGAIRIDNGDWVNGGYSFKFVSAHSATSFTVTSSVTISGPCRNSAGQLTGTNDVLTVPMGTVTYTIPAGSQATDWLPTGDANSVLSWEGSVVAAGLCGGGGNSLDASKGAVFHATVAQNPPSGSLVDFRFKYRDPAAKGKPNTNCLDTTDPNRAKADVCGASWSQTVRDP